MPTLKEMAEAEYPETMESRPLRVACIGAYLAGAKAALEMAEKYLRGMADLLKPKNGDEFGYFNSIKSALHNVANQIRALIPES